MVLQNPLYLTIIIYLILVGAILYTKPNFLYMENSKKLKIFGTGSKSQKTIFPLWLIFLISLVLVYSVLCVFMKY